MTAEPDGYTLLWAASPSHFLTPYVSKTFTYDPLKDFLPIASVGSNSNVLVVVPSVPAKTLAELIAYAKANPVKLRFGFGQGTFPNLLGSCSSWRPESNFPAFPTEAVRRPSRTCWEDIFT